MRNLDEAIAIATRHVEEGRQIVERQKKLIAEKRGGHDAADLLKTFERSLDIFERDLARLISERDKK